jgi:small subunit ribosomal protein S8
VGRVLRLIQSKGYVGEIEFIDDGRQGKFRVQLFGRINKCSAISPRFKTKVSEMEKWEKRFLPSRNLGTVILSTPKGVMDHNQAKDENVGGVLIAYVY